MLQADKPQDFVIATQKQYSVRQFVTLCFALAGRPIEWRGSGINEEGIDKTSQQVLVKISEKYFRPTEVETLLGDPTKAKQELGWAPETSFKELVFEMLDYDFKRQGLALPPRAAEIAAI